MNESLKKFIRISGILLGSLVVLIVLVSLLFVGKGSNNLALNQRQMMNDYDSSSFGMGSAEFPAPSLPRQMENIGMQKESMPIGGYSFADEMAYDVAPSAGPPSDEKKVIKTGYISMTVVGSDEAAEKVGDIVRAHGGEVFSSNFSQRTKNSKSGTVTVKVPMNEFESTFVELKKIGTQVLNESTSGQDVTAEYTDLQAQLKNKQREEEAVAKILEQSGKIDDVLAVTRELSRVRGEIERLQGRIRYMDSQTDMSTITVNLTEDVTIVPVSDGWRPYQVIKSAIKQLIKNSQQFVDGLISFIIVQLPTLLIFLAIFWLVYKLARKVVEKYIRRV